LGLKPLPSGDSVQRYGKLSSRRHTIYDIKYNLVWVTKYRYRVLAGDIGLRLRDLVRQVCMAREVNIIKGHVSADHVHLFVSAPPNISVSKLVQYIKGNSSHRLQMEFDVLRKRYRGQHIWARATASPTSQTRPAR